MTADMSGKFDYNSLVAMLRNKGVANKDLASATKKIGADNNIDDIKELDKSQSIKISSSIFAGINGTEATNPFATNNNELLKSYGINPEAKINELPEIYNDSEYEVADYDDYYGFASNESTTNTISTTEAHHVNNISNAIFTSPFVQQKEQESDSSSEEDESKKGLSMEMDMQNNSFDPQG